MSEIKLLNVLDIYLDSENPRHVPINNQTEIITHLLKNEKVRNLAKDIAANGISPIELFAVIKDSAGHYVALEGNRRLCALTLLNDPRVAPNNEQVNYFKKLVSGSSKPPSAVRCAIFDNREDADIWIERRHEGEQDGVGTRSWDSNQISRHKRGKDKVDNNALALSILDYSTTQGFLTEKNKTKILTTASRYLGNPYFRKTLGIVSGRSDAEIVINVSFEEFDRVIERFSHDLVDKDSGVNSRTKQADWENYADFLIKNGIAPTRNIEKIKLSDKNRLKTKGTSSTTSGNNDVGGGTTSNGGTNNSENSSSSSNNPNGNPGSTKGSTTRHPDKRLYLVSSDFKAPIKDKILRRIFEELKTILVDDKPLAVSLVARAFLENVYSEFLEKQTGSYPKMPIHVVMEKVLKIIEEDTDLSKKELNSLASLRKVQSNTDNILNPKSLGANAHGSIYPSARELKREWDNIVSIIEYMLRKNDALSYGHKHRRSVK